MITIHRDLIQGSKEWFDARLGILTASEMDLIVTPGTLKSANNDKQRGHLYELLAQRITKFVEPHYVGDDMLRGHDDEIDARAIYEDNYDDVEVAGFIVNDKFRYFADDGTERTFSLGFSPDGLVGALGIIECKSRRQKHQVKTILDDAMPDDYRLQVQTGLLVSEREWCDFVTYSAGLPMFTKRVVADAAVQCAIVDAAKSFHQKLDAMHADYLRRTSSSDFRLIPTERKQDLEVFV